MNDREKCVGSKWKDEGNGYFSMSGSGPAGVKAAMTMIGQGSGGVAYVALPKGHPDIGKDYDELNPDVNGGLTFCEGNIFGWDYAHYQNHGTPEEHIKNALEYFRAREKKNKIQRS